MPLKDLDARREYNKARDKSAARIKSRMIRRWIKMGLIEEDINGLYEHVITTFVCDICDCILKVEGPNCSATRCMDHNHLTGEFRNVLCNKCNFNEGP